MPTFGSRKNFYRPRIAINIARSLRIWFLHMFLNLTHRFLAWVFECRISLNAEMHALNFKFCAHFSHVYAPRLFTSSERMFIISLNAKISHLFTHAFFTSSEWMFIYHFTGCMYLNFEFHAHFSLVYAQIFRIQWTNVLYHFTGCDRERFEFRAHFSLVYARIFHIQRNDVNISSLDVCIKFWISRAFLTCLRANFLHSVN